MRIPAAFQPLRQPVYRGLWFAWLAANLTMWMNDVAAAWLMTTLTTSPLMVALVSTASTLPVFLLGLPSGALADIVDRRRYFALTQLWVSVNALLLTVCAMAGVLTAELLLVLTFVNGVGLAMRWPVFASIVPQVVARAELPQAVALGGVAMNLSRVVGPAIAGSLLAVASPAAVFALNTLLAAVSFALILRWRSPPRTSTLPGERFVAAMRTGINFTRQSARLKLVLMRIFLFFLQNSALVSLLPLVARDLRGGGAGAFTLMVSVMGVGGITAALALPRWRQRFTGGQLVAGCSAGQALLSVLIIVTDEIWIALPAMLLVGMSFITLANTLNVAAQAAMPDWVRARGMSLYQMSLMGGSAVGSLLWGHVAGRLGVDFAVGAAAVSGLIVLVATRRMTIDWGRHIDFTPAPLIGVPEPAFPVDPDEGPVMVTVHYQIDPARAAEFAQVMELTRRARLRQGALSWGLFRDITQPGVYVEYFVDETWLEHQRRLERFTAFDAGLRDQRMAFHIGEEPPVIRRYVADSLLERPDTP